MHGANFAASHPQGQSHDGGIDARLAASVHPLLVDRLGDTLVGLRLVEVDGMLVAVPEAVDVGGVGIDVLPQAVGVLE